MEKNYYIDQTSWYPVHTIDPTTTWRPLIKLTPEEFADYSRVMLEFDAWQDKLIRALHPEDPTKTSYRPGKT